MALEILDGQRGKLKLRECVRERVFYLDFCASLVFVSPDAGVYEF